MNIHIKNNIMSGCYKINSKITQFINRKVFHGKTTTLSFKCKNLNIFRKMFRKKKFCYNIRLFLSGYINDKNNWTRYQKKERLKVTLSIV